LYIDDKKRYSINPIELLKKSYLRVNPDTYYNISGYLNNIENSEYFEFANLWKTRTLSFDLSFL